MSNPETNVTREIPFVFTGKAGEYFLIWLVNILLTIVTLGIYSAWAKVRTKRYFYGNTLLDDSPFEFDANPITILKGRLIAVVALVGLNFALEFMPMIGGVLLFLLIFITPWLVNQSLKFRNYYSQYRNIRFRFQGSYGKAAWIFIGLPLLNPFTLGLLTPYFEYRRRKYSVEQSSYGAQPFTFSASAGAFYRVFLEISLYFIGVFALLGIISATLSQGFDFKEVLEMDEETRTTVIKTMMLFILPILLVGFLWIFNVYRARLTNLTWNHTALAGHRFESTLSPVKLFWISLTNGLMIWASMGLMIPWAQIRMARYRASSLILLADGSLDEFIAANQQKMEALGAEMDDVFDIDMAPGL